MKSVRSIAVAGRRWSWRVRREGAEWPGYVTVRIWRAEDRGNAARLDVRARFDDPWLFYGEMLTTPPERADVWETRPVAPKQVAAMIEQALALGWDVAASRTTRTARWEGERLLLD